MVEKHPVREYDGSAYKVVPCDGAKNSFEQALTRLGGQKGKMNRMRDFLEKSLEDLSNGKRLSSESLRKEAAIEGTKGVGDGKGDIHFYALKKIPIRAYIWFSPDKHTVYISHCIYKDQNKLAESDIQKVRNNFEK